MIRFHILESLLGDHFWILDSIGSRISFACFVRFECLLDLLLKLECINYTITDAFKLMTEIHWDLLACFDKFLKLSELYLLVMTLFYSSKPLFCIYDLSVEL